MHRKALHTPHIAGEADAGNSERGAGVADGTLGQEEGQKTVVPPPSSRTWLLEGDSTLSAPDGACGVLILLEGLEVRNHVGALLRLLDAGKRHLRARHELLRVLQVHVQHFRRPDYAGIGVRLAVREALDLAGGAVDDAEQVRAHTVGATLGGSVALGSAALEQLLAALHVTRRQGRTSLRRHDECGVCVCRFGWKGTGAVRACACAQARARELRAAETG